MDTNKTRIKYITYRQKQAVRFWIKGGRKSMADALRKANYSNAVIRQPRKVFNSPAVVRELDLLGHGFDGLSNGLKPKEVIPVVEKERKTEPTFDISSFTKEQIQDIKEKLENTPPRNPVALMQKNEQKDRYYVPKNSPNHNIFGEELSNTHKQEEDMKMSDLSSI